MLTSSACFWLLSTSRGDFQPFQEGTGVPGETFPCSDAGPRGQPCRVCAGAALLRVTAVPSRSHPGALVNITEHALPLDPESARARRQPDAEAPAGFRPALGAALRA